MTATPVMPVETPAPLVQWAVLELAINELARSTTGPCPWEATVLRFRVQCLWVRAGDLCLDLLGNLDADL